VFILEVICDILMILVLLLEVICDILMILVLLLGLSGTGVNAGGGSGGSVWIETMNMTGHGEIRTHGGNGTGLGGGGAGGRVSIHCQFR
jgi:hypothetical protein